MPSVAQRSTDQIITALMLGPRAYNAKASTREARLPNLVANGTAKINSFVKVVRRNRFHERGERIF